TGSTRSNLFPTTANAIQPTSGSVFGGADAFVTVLNPSGTALLYSSYLGGNQDDIGFGIALDSSLSAYVAGRTDSTNFPTTPGAFRTTPPGGGSDAFVTKIANIVCTRKEDDVEGDGHEQGDDGH